MELSIVASEDTIRQWLSTVARQECVEIMGLKFRPIRIGFIPDKEGNPKEAVFLRSVDRGTSTGNSPDGHIHISIA